MKCNEAHKIENIAFGKSTFPVFFLRKITQYGVMSRREKFLVNINFIVKIFNEVHHITVYCLQSDLTMIDGRYELWIVSHICPRSNIPNAHNT